MSLSPNVCQLSFLKFPAPPKHICATPSSLPTGSKSKVCLRVQIVGRRSWEEKLSTVTILRAPLQYHRTSTRVCLIFSPPRRLVDQIGTDAPCATLLLTLAASFCVTSCSPCLLHPSSTQPGFQTHLSIFFLLGKSLLPCSTCY